MDYIARTNKNKDGSLPNGETFRAQALIEHLLNVGNMAGKFAKVFNMEAIANFLGKCHDIGKYSRDFQQRVRGEDIRVDHSTAGGKEASAIVGQIFSNIIFGHHGGLLDFGNNAQHGDDHLRSVMVRLKNTKIPDYSSFKKEMTLDNPMEIFQNNLKTNFSLIPDSAYSHGFLIRMLFSCVVDSDFLDAECFMHNNRIARGEHDSIENLLDKLNAYFSSKRFFEPKNEINQIRKGILENCLKKAKSSRGVYSLTVPTGGGKTLSSMAFALNHAKINKMQRIIYVIPYTSIIEQNAGVFKDIFEPINVLENHSNVIFENAEDELYKNNHLASENWDIPIVVTTNVQFFESLYTHKTSKARKLHNIANSVLIFDEAQMLPTNYLKPCVYAIDELVRNYKCTAVLCTATQPLLKNVWPNNFKINEICDNHIELYDKLKRVTYKNVGTLNDKELVSELLKYNQVLCIVNTKKQAQNLYEMLGEDAYHLSTQMCPAHRRETLDEIKSKLEKGEIIRLISTSLIEAGVDIDFSTVFRAKAGLDSIIQAGGRCNREDKRLAKDSIVYIFDCDVGEYKVPDYIKQNVSATESAFRNHKEMDSPDAIKAYFNFLYTLKGEFLDSKNIIKRHKLPNIEFEQISKDFKLIEDNDGGQVIIPYNSDAENLISDLKEYGVSRTLIRKLTPYIVNTTVYQREEMLSNGHIERIFDTDLYVIVSSGDIYSQSTGLKMKTKPRKSEAIMI
ncbi:MAG: CRISPR-associated helicase Cas3' [Defluviitaleaceae bacterium]|nr:CRISPR-associated helicase Cas3' [Defluviitaleaceae bacterium]